MTLDEPPPGYCSWGSWEDLGYPLRCTEERVELSRQAEGVFGSSVAGKMMM